MKEETWDIVIVGSGASGLSAAVTAASPNCTVLVLEKCAALGGTTAMAIGSVTAAGTRLQARAGIKDSSERFLHDLNGSLDRMGLKGRNNEELNRVLVEQAASAVDWITDLGASFVGPFHESFHRVPRMHNIVPNAKSYISILRQAAVKRGVTIKTGYRVSELITSGGGVTGIKAVSSTGTAIIRINKAIILATGDYSSNREMKMQFMSGKAAQVDGINPDSTGDGHLMALSLGAAVRNMDVSIGPILRFISPRHPSWIESLPSRPVLTRIMGAVAKYAPRNFFRFVAKKFLTAHTSPSAEIYAKGAILLNKDAERFTNELQSAPSLAVAVASQPGKIAYVFFDAALARLFSAPPNYLSTAPGIAYAYLNDYRVLRKDIFYSGRTIVELAKKLGVNPLTLVKTVDAYNHCIATTQEDVFGRTPLGQGFHNGPFYALGPVQGSFSSVEGGLSVDSKCRVLTPGGQVIRNLYAAGKVGQGGLILPGHGMHIAWALVSGRIAGQNAKEEAASGDGKQ